MSNNLYIKLYPGFKIQNSEFKISIYNLLGQCMVNNKIIRDNVSFSLQKGAYLLRVVSDNLKNIYVKKIIVE
jgi:hypothetical protein